MAEENTAPAEKTASSDDTGKTFTQEQVNSFLADQKRKIQASYADYDDLKAKAAQVADYDDLKAKAAQVDEFQSRITELEATNSDLDGKIKTFEADKERAELVADVAKDKKVPAEALRGSTREELEAHADQLAELFKPSGPVIPGQERTPNTTADNAPSEETTFVRGLFSGD